ncbi:unnamed protein product [Paramecium octaurelia]|uniref:Uncharacterized protein n=1 Tax=Paramecium octaurelia TaxID=43137 RepID=A0A8S1UGA3_PAROT|nr:unnamed protein product [Paramecium octaurelia]
MRRAWSQVEWPQIQKLFLQIQITIIWEKLSQILYKLVLTSP